MNVKCFNSTFAIGNRRKLSWLTICVMFCLSGQVFAKKAPSKTEELAMKKHHSSIVTAEANEAQGSQQGKREITGTVVDSYGEPIPGVSVVIKGTTTGTITAGNGQFNLKAVPEDAVLKFSFVGMDNQEVAVKDRTDFNIVMKESFVNLNEVVAIGYGSIKKANVATAVAKVDPDEFNVAGGRDTRALLEGKVAGLNITRTGGSSPNSSVSIQLRGVVSVNGDQSPLVVIDGIPGGSMDLLNPEDIESMSVLKDGSAAAIYGSQANAGVILITTKKGGKDKEGHNRIEYSTYVTQYGLKKRADFMNASQYRSYMEELGDPSYMEDYGGSTDWYEALMDKSNFSQSHVVALSGGNPEGSTNYRASFYYNNLNGIAIGDGRKQYGGRFALTGKAFYDMLTYQTNIATNFNKADMRGNSNWETDYRRNPTLPIKDEDGDWYELAGGAYNYVAQLAQMEYTRDQQTTSADTKISLEPLDGLKASAFGSVIRDQYGDDKYYDKDSRVSVDSYDGGGYAYKKSYYKTKYDFEPTISYNTKIAETHSLSAVAGYSYQYSVYETLAASNYDFLSDATSYNDIGAGGALTDGDAGLSSYKEDETLIAFFGRVNYSLNDKYLAQVSYRREGSSKFGENNKWGNFPAASLGWNISHENFMQQLPAVSDLKLRAGYGVTGNSGIDPYKSLASLGTGGYYINDDGEWVQTYGPSSNVNYNLKWEVKKETNIGIDYGFLKNRLTGSIDYFIRRTEDLLANENAAVPSSLKSTIFGNVGTIDSHGIEFEINYVALDKNEWHWNVGFNCSTIKNRFMKFTNDPDTNYEEYASIGGYGAMGKAIRTYAGDEIGNFYGKRFAGFDEDGEWLFYNADGEKVSADDIDIDNDGAILGNAVPNLYANLNSSVNYKNVDFSIGFRGKFGFQVLNRTEMEYGNALTLQSGMNVLNDVREGNGVNASYQYSDYYIENGDFVKLDNVTIGYSFKNMKKLKLPTFRVYFTGRDLLTSTGYSGVDPEVEDTGLAVGIEYTDRTPVTRSYTLGLKVEF